MPARQPPVPLPHRGADGIDDHGVGHGSILPQGIWLPKICRCVRFPSTAERRGVDEISLRVAHQAPIPVDVDEIEPMDLRFTPEQEQFRRRARAWLEANAPAPHSLPSLDTPSGFEAHRAWEQTMYAHRWSVVSWPEEYGGQGVGILEWLIFEEEYWRVQAPLRVSQNGVFLLAPTLFEFGTDAQQAAVPAAHGVGGGDLVPGLVGAGRRQRPGRHPQPGGPGPGGRRLAADRPEDLGLPGGVRRVVLRPVPDRSGRRAAPGASPTS